MRLEVISRMPRNPISETPVLFLHGAWHAAWCWEKNFLPFFATAGFKTYALSFRGHGSSEGLENKRFMRINDYIEDVQQVVSSFDVPPIIVGHSMGGLVVQKYLEDHSARAGILLAPVPVGGALFTFLRQTVRHPIQVLKVLFGMSMRHMIANPHMVQELFFSDNIPNEELEYYSKKVEDEAYLVLFDMLLLALPRPARVKTRLLLLGGDKDRMFTPGEVKATAEAYNAPSEIFSDIPHDMMLDSNWQVVADRMLHYMKEVVALPAA